MASFCLFAVFAIEQHNFTKKTNVANITCAGFELTTIYFRVSSLNH